MSSVSPSWTSSRSRRNSVLFIVGASPALILAFFTLFMLKKHFVSQFRRILVIKRWKTRNVEEKVTSLFCSMQEKSPTKTPKNPKSYHSLLSKNLNLQQSQRYLKDKCLYMELTKFKVRFDLLKWPWKFKNKLGCTLNLPGTLHIYLVNHLIKKWIVDTWFWTGFDPF